MRDFFIEHKYFIVSGLILGLLFIVRNSFLSNHDAPSESVFVSIEATQTPDNSFYIEVVGSVRSPGVYKVTDNVLVMDAITLAGGYTDNADIEYVEQYIPFSKRVYPEMKIFIPYLKSMQADGLFKLNINTATKEQLIAIKGVGEITALKIIEMRPFNSWEHLQIITGIRNDIIDSLKDAATF